MVWHETVLRCRPRTQQSTVRCTSVPRASAVCSKRSPPQPTLARLAIVFGDQLDLDSALIRELGPDDTVLIMEVATESRHVPSHVQRTALFLSAVRRFAAELVRPERRVRRITGTTDQEPKER